MSNKFVIATIDFFNNDLKQEIVYSDKSLIEMYRSFFTKFFAGVAEELNVEPSDMSIEDIKSYLFESELAISIIEV